MLHIVFGLISFLISAFAFGFGATRLFRKKKPLYLQILVCAAGCCAMGQMSRLVNLWCGVTEAAGIGMFGIFGSNFFLLSANFGTLDRIVDDGKGSQKARRLAVLAPICTAVLTGIAFFSWKDRDLFCAILWLILLLPALPASYFNLKHILLPMDPFEFLRVTAPCNGTALAFYTVTGAYVICSAAGNDIAVGICSVLMSLSVLLLSVFAVRGSEKWGI